MSLIAPPPIVNTAAPDIKPPQTRRVKATILTIAYPLWDAENKRPFLDTYVLKGKQSVKRTKDALVVNDGVQTITIPKASILFDATMKTVVEVPLDENYGLPV